MTEMLGTIFLTAIVAFLPGLLVGYLYARKNQKALLEKEYDRAKEEFDGERLELSEDLGKQLSKIRQSIIQSVEAYESAAKAVEDKCLKNIKNHPALASMHEPQRQIDFFSNATEGTEPSSTGGHGVNSRSVDNQGTDPQSQFEMPFEGSKDAREKESRDEEARRTADKPSNSLQARDNRATTDTGGDHSDKNSDFDKEPGASSEEASFSQDKDDTEMSPDKKRFDEWRKPDSGLRNDEDDATESKAANAS